MGKHRTRLKILENVLVVINDNKGAKKTQIMYQAYLSYKLLIRYLSDVMKAGLVTCDKGNCYKITKKGENLLARFNEYYKSHETFQKHLNLIEDQRSILEEMCSNNNTANGEKSTLENKN